MNDVRIKHVVMRLNKIMSMGAEVRIHKNKVNNFELHNSEVVAIVYVAKGITATYQLEGPSLPVTRLILLPKLKALGQTITPLFEELFKEAVMHNRSLGVVTKLEKLWKKGANLSPPIRRNPRY